MHFVVTSESPLFEKLKELEAQMEHCHEKAKESAQKYGCTGKFIMNPTAAYGGLFAIALDKKPEGWKESKSKSGFYMPAMSSLYKKANYPIVREWEMLPELQREDLCKVVGFRSQFVGMTHYRCPGYSFYETMVHVEIDDACDYTPIEGMTEVTTTQLKKMLADIKEKEVSDV
jgi:hypothetical protein